ncbi:MAG TPA: hypothetical protein VNN55_10440 [bacterium]|nr:hypothetical protein [bacterium]
MAISDNVQWEVRADGSDNNGGGFVAGASGTDYSQQAGAHASGIDLTVDAISDIDVQPDGYTPVAADIGNIIQITAGAGWVLGWYQIVGIVGTQWRLDRSPAPAGSTGGVWALGGALASPGKGAAALVLAGSKLWIRSGTYTITSSTANVSGGTMSLANATKSIIGYGTTRGDGGRPTIVADSLISSFALITNGSVYSVNNLILDGNSRPSSRGIQTTGSNGFVTVRNCKGQNFTNGFISGLGIARDCYATGCTSVAPFSINHCVSCVADGNSVSGFSWTTQSSVFAYCLSVNNSGAGSDGFVGNNNILWVHCVAYNNGRHGFSISAGSQPVFSLVSCIAYQNAGTGFMAGSAYSDMKLLYNCAAGANGTNFSANFGSGTQVNSVTLTADPFTNAAGKDFSLNNTAGGGAAARSAGFGTYPEISTTGYPDVGAAQHADPPAGGGGGSLIAGGLVVT